MEHIKVFLVDDEELLLDSLEIILTLAENIKVIGKAKDGIEALRLLENVEPDIALIDLNMKGMGGLELIEKIKELYPFVKILVLTTFYDHKNITAAVANGADGYLLKDSGKDTIINGIKNLLKGQSILDNRVMQELSKIVSRTDNSADLIYHKLSEKLTKREAEIAVMMAEGYTNSQIAE